MVARGILGYDDFKLQGQLGSRAIRTLVQVQEIVSANGPYHYLEIGSFLGRSLQPHVQDSDCLSALSIDLRPSITPDERGDVTDYADITAEDMLENLGTVCSKEDLEKLRCRTTTSESLRTDPPNEKYHLALIDGEHTNIAVFRDFLNVLSVSQPDAVICFDDTSLVYAGICNAIAHLEAIERPHAWAFAKGEITVLAVGEQAKSTIDQLDPDIIRPEFRVQRQARRRIVEAAIAGADAQEILNARKAELVAALRDEKHR